MKVLIAMALYVLALSLLFHYSTTGGLIVLVISAIYAINDSYG